ncbi:MAG: NAD-dependent epimerase/dehydratase family protein [Acidobacteriota bacterium]
MRDIFVSGGTGYLGRALVPALVRRGHPVRVLTRGRLGSDPSLVRGDALEAATFAGSIRPSDTFLHMVGLAHPAPWKAAQFEAVDVASVRATLAAVKGAGLSHLVYVSVAQSAPFMAAYTYARARCERWIVESGIPATFLRPWYVLGPGHQWASPAGARKRCGSDS